MRFSVILLIFAIAIAFANAQTIVGVVGGQPTLSTLQTNLGLVPSLQTLLNGAGNFTLFAPNNAAFSNLPAANSTGFYGSLNQTLYYHVINGLLPATNALDTVYQSLVSGASLRVNQYGASPFSGALLVNGQPLGAPLVASNGQVRIVDQQVLYIPLGDPATALTRYTNFTIAISLVQRAGFNLNTLNPATIFVPTNDAFIAFNQTLQTVGNNLNLLTNSQITQLFNNHIVGVRAAFFSGAFTTTLATVNSENGNGTFSLNVTLSGGNVIVTSSGNTTAATVVIPNVVTTTGVFHGVNRVLYPAGFVVPPPATTSTTGTTGTTTGTSSTTGSSTTASASSIAASLILLIFSVFIACF